MVTVGWAHGPVHGSGKPEPTWVFSASASASAAVAWSAIPFSHKFSHSMPLDLPSHRLPATPRLTHLVLSHPGSSLVAPHSLLLKACNCLSLTGMSHVVCMVPRSQDTPYHRFVLELPLPQLSLFYLNLLPYLWAPPPPCRSRRQLTKHQFLLPALRRGSVASKTDLSYSLPILRLYSAC